jgi:SAM-dependent methyltransferase
VEDVMSQVEPHLGWQLRQSAAEAYERHLVPAIFAAWARDLVDRVEVKPGDRVLDVACGTGIVARLAAERVGPTGSVVGLDVNRDMLKVARAVTSGVDPAIEWLEGDAHAVPLPDAAVDVTLCQFAVMFFTDPLTALSEMRRVTVHTGPVAFSVWRSPAHNVGYALLADALERTAGAEAGVIMRSPFAGGDADELRAAAVAAGLRDVRIRLDAKVVRYPSAEHMVRVEAASSPLGGAIGALDAGAYVRLIDEVTAALAPYADDDGVALPAESYVVTARA